MLSEADRDFIGHASEGRQREFAAGRRCARLALEALGSSNVEVSSGESREPVWPTGLIGSITHSGQFALAAVARQQSGVGLGIDTERLGRLKAGMYRRLFTPVEQRRLARLTPAQADLAATISFSAKEAFYKAQFPLTEASVGFQDVEMSVELDQDPTEPIKVSATRATALTVLEQFRWPLEVAVTTPDPPCTASEAVPTHVTTSVALALR